MKMISFVTAVILLAPTVDAAFTPFTLAQKAERADLILRGKVVLITRLTPDTGLFGSDDLVGFDGTSGRYVGPRSVAVIVVLEVLKMPEGTAFRGNVLRKRTVLPRRIMVPCDYSSSESPSDLTVDRSYVLFLRDMSANMYHPLDPSSTHVVHDGRVADFGMNHPADRRSPVPGRESFLDRSTLFVEFKKHVLELLKTAHEVDDQKSR